MNDRPADDECCDYCGLPVKAWSSGTSIFGRRRGSQSADQGQKNAAAVATPAYCCYGCRFAAAVSAERGPRGDLSWTLARLGLSTFLTMNVMMFTMALWTNDVYAADAENAALSASLESFFRYLCLVLSLPVAWMLGLPLADNAWRGLRAGRPGTDLLLLAGVLAAFAFSAASTLRGAGHVYFEVGCVVLVSVTFGRWLEATGRHKTTQALDALQRLLPDVARLIRQGQEENAPLAQVVPGDKLRVLPGERIPVDGVIERGTAAVDEQLLTGESQPVLKSRGEKVHGGTLNLDGDLQLLVTAGPSAGALQRLIDAVHQARKAKGHYESLADRVACWFMPGVAVISLSAFATHAAWSGWEQGVLAGLAVVLIACPCALGLATPMAAWAALGTASRAQVLFRDAGAMERLARVKAVAFDKTGTLTTGTPRIRQWLLSPKHAQAGEVLARAAALSAGSTHAISTAIAGWIENGGPGLETPSADWPGTKDWHLIASDIRALPGRGVEGRFDDLEGVVLLGSLRLMRERHLSIDSGMQEEVNKQVQAGHSLAAIGWAGRVHGVIFFEEQPRPAARPALADCQKLGLHIFALTGDHQQRGAALAADLQVDVQAGLLPDDKVAALELARRRWGPVVMVGDGINDAPALAAADVGVALGCGADVSRQSADVCLLGNDLRRVAWSVAWAQRTVVTMRQNLFWALIYNVLGIGLAAAGWLNPVWAAVAMVASSLLVVGNSLRLSRDPTINPVDGGAPSPVPPDIGRATNEDMAKHQAARPLVSPPPLAMLETSAGETLR
ncbi:MAG: heavy metal translocating P-type ATPase [Pirellulales bacterium]